jgi:cyclopropane-fatty-acyl-phospholipid synthase
MVLTSVAGEKDLPRWFETFFSVMQRLEAGAIEIGLPDGRVFKVSGKLPGPVGRIDVANPEFFTRIARDGDIGFAEMFMEGWWHTPDLQALLDALLLNNDNVASSFPGAALVRAYERLRHWLHSNTRRGARRNIAYHYDLGNEFYRLWLDKTMTYSSALFSGQGETLHQAQQNKYASVCDRMGLKRGDHVLEIGCGWGGFAEYAIRERGARVTGLTLSREQHDFARQRLFDAGLAEHAEIVLRDYRDETGTYDGIASIEMFERSTDFIQKYIFPGGMLPSPSALRRESAVAGLEIVGSIEFAESYSRTLRAWREAFNSRWGEIAKLGFDERFHRMWNFYLAVCAACFSAGTTDVTQISLRRTP